MATSYSGLSPAIAWKILWSPSGYRGWDHRFYIECAYGSIKGGYDYVEKYCFGHEWWNFYEGFSDKYYYGYAAPIHVLRPKRFIDGGVVFFVSRNIYDRLWYLVGVYGKTSIMDKPYTDLSLWDTVPMEYRNEISKRTREQLETEMALYLRAEKEYSTQMPRPMPLDMERDIGVRVLGQAGFMYLNINKAIDLLDKAIEFIEQLSHRVLHGLLWTEPGRALSRLEKLRSYLMEYKQKPVISTPLTLQQRHITTGREREENTRESISIHTMGSSGETIVPERLVEDTLARDLNIIEDGLELIGRQIHLPGVGRADIIARDKNDRLVVIEVKSGIADDTTLTQILAYMSALRQREDREVRGIIVANGFSKKLVHAAKLISNIKLVEIRVNITIAKTKVYP
ncbi:DUF91 domain-containing protein [Desulfurococcaceae archaeon MEX13E-LK6-19]|nr:DUF91 domain-containing protein [Desulfurococcaceae archaeon MEX13E-LK6-19]